MVHLQAYLFCDLRSLSSQSVGVNMVNPIVLPVVSDIVELGVSLGVDQELTQHTCWTWRLMNSCHCLLSIWGPQGASLLREETCQETKADNGRPCNIYIR